MMNLIQRASFAIAKRALKYAGVPLRDPALQKIFGVSPTHAGVSMDTEIAKGIAAYFSGIQLISSAIANIGFEVMQVATDGSMTKVEDHPLDLILNVSPNPNTLPYNLIEQTQRDALSTGNGFIRIHRREGTRFVNALEPLEQSRVKIEFDYTTKIKTFHYTVKGSSTSEEIQSDDMIHIPGYEYDGVRGRAVADVARQSLALTYAMETFGASSFGNSTIPSDYIQHPGSLDPEAVTRLQDQIARKHQGPLNAGKLLILDEGMAIKSKESDLDKAQFIESRVFQVLEICRWLRIPPHMLYEVSASTIGSIEDQGRDFLTYTLGPWITVWVQELRRKLFTTTESLNHVFRLKNNGEKLTQANMSTRFENYAKGRNSLSIFTVNDILRKEGMPISDNPMADSLIAPSTMKILGENDPSVAINPAVYTQLFELFDTFETEIPLQLATQLIKSVIPSADDKLIKELVTFLDSAERKPDPTTTQQPKKRFSNAEQN